jgi:hypothetical protein
MKTRSFYPARALSALFILFLLTACETTNVQPQASQAKAETPVVAKVEWVSLPFETETPLFVIAVLPFADGSAGTTAGNALPAAPQVNGMAGVFGEGGLQGGGVNGVPAPQNSGPIGHGMAAQFKTALMRWGNISIIDAAALIRKEDGTYICKLNAGEVGPFLIRGTVTEFNEAAEGTEKNKGMSLGGVGAMLGLIGLGNNNSGLANAGGVLATANPTIQNEEKKRTGMVGIDIEILDGRSTRLVGAFNCSGTFTTMSKVNGVSVFGMGGGSASFASSAIGQATRAALNDALKQSADVLKRAPRGNDSKNNTIEGAVEKRGE